MVSIEYANAYSEVLGILRYVSKEDFEKIPNSKIELFETNKNKEYTFDYDPNKTLEEQNVSKRAKAIIGILFRDYWATEEQRSKIIKKQNDDRKILDDQKISMDDVNDLFKKRNSENDIKENEESNEETKEMVVYKETFFRKCINKIKSLFNIN